MIGLGMKNNEKLGANIMIKTMLILLRKLIIIKK